MGVADRLSEGRRVAAQRPGLAIVWFVAAYLALDLVMKVAGQPIRVGSTQVLGGQFDIGRLVKITWDGIVIGLAIGLAGVGLSMTYSILTFANFAHGDYVTAGAFIGWATAFGIVGAGTTHDGEPVDLGYLLLVGEGQGPSAGALGINVLSTPLAVFVGLLVAAVGTVALVMLIDRVVYRPMRDQGAISLLIASIGVALALRYVMVFVFTGSPKGLTAETSRFIFAGVNGKIAIADQRSTLILARNDGPPDDAFYQELPFLNFGNYSNEILSVTTHEVTLVVIAVALMYGVHVLLQRTKLGTAMRAMADNEDLARVSGIPTERVIRATWVIGAALAGAAGFLIALENGTMDTSLGWGLLLLIFAAVILGGIGSIYGAIGGGLIIALTTNLSTVWIPSDFSTAAAFAIMILVLLFKPEGLFGGITTA